MATLRRILKFTPAVVVGLLVVMWVVSAFRAVGVGLLPLRPSLGGARTIVWAINGSLQYSYYSRGSLAGGTCERVYVRHFAPPEAPTGRFRWVVSQEYLFIGAPIPCLLLALVPLAIGPFISFRFRLWHYLAYTALVALELAYYLRWRE